MTGRSPRRNVAIVGAGFSGSLLALHLLSRSDGPKVFLIEKAGRFGPGLAYSTRRDEHLLNVRAGNMSAWPDRPFDFLYWLSARRGDEAADPAAFASRADYGAYLRERIAEAATSGAAADRLVLVEDEAVAAVRDGGDGLVLRLGMGREIAADAVVLAFGNPPPVAPDAVRQAALPKELLIDDPWRPGALDGIAADAPVLLLGAGLTMADVVAALDADGHRGPILALSRRGLAPHRHVGPMSAEPPLFERIERLSTALAAFRRAAAGRGDWRPLFDGLRPATQGLWRSLSPAERERFLRHLRPWWDIHRHRLAPATADRLDALRAEGRLRIAAGRLEHLAAGGEAARVEARWRPRGGRAAETGAFAHVVVCTGPDSDLRQAEQPLLRQLLAHGMIRPDPCRLGLDVAEDGRVRDGAGVLDARLFALGPATRGAFWETTAVPDIRVQAADLARRLTEALAPA